MDEDTHTAFIGMDVKYREWKDASSSGRNPGCGSSM